MGVKRENEWKFHARDFFLCVSRIKTVMDTQFWYVDISRKGV